MTPIVHVKAPSFSESVERIGLRQRYNASLVTPTDEPTCGQGFLVPDV